MKPIHMIVASLVILMLVGVVGVAGLLFFRAATRETTPTESEDVAAAKHLRNAFRQFHLQYDAYPSYEDPASPEDATLFSYEETMAILLGTDRTLNSQGIIFGEWRDADSNQRNGIIRDTLGAPTGALVDSTGSLFRIVIDSNGDGIVEDPLQPGIMLQENILVFGAGPDGDYDTWDDNPRTW